MNSNTSSRNIAVLGKETSLKKYFIRNFEYRYEKRIKEMLNEKPNGVGKKKIHLNFPTGAGSKILKVNVFDVLDNLFINPGSKKNLKNTDCFIYLYQNDSSKYIEKIFQTISKYRTNLNIPIVVFFANQNGSLKFTLFFGQCDRATFQCLKDYAKEYLSDYENFIPVLQNQLDAFVTTTKSKKQVQRDTFVTTAKTKNQIQSDTFATRAKPRSQVEPDAFVTTANSKNQIQSDKFAGRAKLRKEIQPDAFVTTANTKKQVRFQ